jgi:hypothetical protein
MSATLELWDYRRRVHDMYRRVRERGTGPESWAQWVAERDDLFATHPQSPIEDRTRFEGLPYFPYDPSWSTTGRFLPTDDESATVAHSGEGATRFVKIGFVEFEVAGNPGRLEVLWLDAYGGGLFLPFRDAGNGVSTYGGGRYLLDTVKGADLGHSENEITIDFNFAYHPSCVHSEQWSCPLAPATNRLPFSVEAGERLAT